MPKGNLSRDSAAEPMGQHGSPQSGGVCQSLGSRDTSVAVRRQLPFLRDDEAIQRSVKLELALLCAFSVAL
jgi:hypothetical protein